MYMFVRDITHFAIQDDVERAASVGGVSALWSDLVLSLLRLVFVEAYQRLLIAFIQRRKVQPAKVRLAPFLDMCTNARC